MNRREFLRTAVLGSSGLLLLNGNGWAAKALGDEKTRKRLVVMLLRGAVDGLNVVVPYSESAYYSSRPTIAIPRPGENGGVLPLVDSHFGLHPALAPIMPFWEQKTLAFVHASGSPDASRSHFDAQDYMETATPGAKRTPDGWLNRLLEVLPGTRSATDGVSIGPTLPRIMSGKVSTTNFSLNPSGTRPTPLDRPEIQSAFDRLYRGSDPLSVAYREGQSARKALLAKLTEEMQMSDQGAPSAVGFTAQAQKLGRLIAKDPSIKVAFVAFGGWDTHINQGSSIGQLANRLRGLGESLAALIQGLGSSYSDTAIIVMSEFGRTAHENGNTGTDHGHGNVMWVAGGSVGGGKIYGQWPGISGSELYEGRDLAITTDFRQVISTVLDAQFSLTSTQLNRVIPNAPKANQELRGLVRV